MKKKNIIILTIIIILIAIIAGFFIYKKIEQESRKYEIATISQYNYVVVRENDKYGVLNTEGNKIVETEYDNVIIPNPEKAVFICYEGENTKVLNENAETIFTEYEGIEPLRLKNISEDLMYEKTTLKYKKDDKYGIINLDGKKITNAIYEEIDTLQYKEGELLVKKDGKYGIININGGTLVKPIYDSVEADKYYEEGNSYKNAGYIVSETTEEGYRYGYVNTDGKEIMETKYNDLYRITEAPNNDIYIICAENGKYGLFKNGKQILSNEYQTLTYNESNNTITALKGKKYGVFSMDGNEIVPIEYTQINITGNYIYATGTDGNVKIFDSNGNEQQDMNQNLAILNIQNTDYEINIQTENNQTRYSIYQNGNKITNNDYIYIEYLGENYFIASNTDGKLGIINDKEENQTDFVYNSIQKIDDTNMIQAYNNTTKITEIYSKDIKKICELENATVETEKGYIKLYNDQQTKYITLDGIEKQNTEIFANNKIFASSSNNKWGFVDKEGNVVIGYDYDKVTEVNEFGFAGIQKDGKWGVINGDGQIILEPTYELNENEPKFIGQYYQVIYGNGEIYYTGK